MSKRKTELQWPPDAPAPDDLSGVNGDDAPPESEAVVAAAPASPPEPPAPAAVDAPATPPAGPVATPAPPEPPLPEPAPWRDIPVASVLPPVAPLLPAPGPSPLEERLHRLEAELARLRAAAPPAPPDPAVSVVRQPGGFWGGVRQTLLAPSAPAAAAPPPKADNLASLVPPGVRRGWLLLDALRELRAMYCMYFDPRYRLSLVGRLAPLVIAALIVTSGLWMPGTGLPWPLGMIIDKVADLVLAYFLFKMLSHEARRYRETAPDLPPSLRL